MTKMASEGEEALAAMSSHTGGPRPIEFFDTGHKQHRAAIRRVLTAIAVEEDALVATGRPRTRSLFLQAVERIGGMPLTDMNPIAQAAAGER